MPPLLLLALSAVFVLCGAWILLKERDAWPVGFRPGRTKSLGFALLLASIAVMATTSFIGALGQARLTGW